MSLVRTIGRLTSEEWLDDSDVAIYSFTYEFDAAGNRSLLTKDGVTTYYSYNTLNQLTLTESTEGALTYYTYQADGALETKHDAEGWAYYEWDVDEALLRVTRDGTLTGQATELYDAQMKRVARDLDGVATYYVFDGEKIARVEQPEAGTRDFYVQEGQSIYSPLVSVHDESVDAQYWYLFDALGSTMGLVDADGSLSGKLQYDAFGNVLEESNVPRSAFFKYVGAYQYMPEQFEGMMLLWHRWYEPGGGRFVGRDKATNTRHWIDQYGVGRTTRGVDPTGLTPLVYIDPYGPRVDWGNPSDALRRYAGCVAACDRTQLRDAQDAMDNLGACVTWAWDKLDPDRICGRIWLWEPGQPPNPDSPNGPLGWISCVIALGAVDLVLSSLALMPCLAVYIGLQEAALIEHSCCMSRCEHDYLLRRAVIPGQWPIKV